MRQRIIAFMSLLLPVFFLHGQTDCDCEDYTVKDEISLLDQKDSVLVLKFLRHLERSAHDICRYKGFAIAAAYYCAINAPEKASRAIQDQESILKKLTDCKAEQVFHLYLNKSLYHRSKNNFEQSYEFAFEALKNAEESGNGQNEIEALKQVVFLLTRMQERKKIWSYVKRTEQLIFEQEKGIRSVLDYRWLAYEYENEYTKTERKTLIDSVLIFVNRVKGDALRYRLNNEATRLYRALEACSYHRGEPKKALRYIDSAIYYGKKLGKRKDLSGLYLSKAWDHLDLKQYRQAEIFMDSALILKTNRDVPAFMMMNYEAANIYEDAGNIKKALQSLKLHHKIKDSLLNLERVGVINDLETKYQTELKDAEIKTLNQEKKINALELQNKRSQVLWLSVLTILATLLALVVFFVFRQRIINTKIKMIQAEQRLNRARLDPHFIFNGMASIQTLAYGENDPKTAEYIAMFANIMRQSLESTYEELISVADEMDFLKKYMEIQKLRYPNKFDYEFKVSDQLEIHELKIPGMLIQPFVENAIEHGFKNLDKNGTITIGFVDSGEQLQISVADNGKGITTQIGKKEYPSRAMQIIEDRLYLFNKQYGSKGLYQVQTSENFEGFRISITLPKLY